MLKYKGATADTLPGYAIAEVYRMLRHATDDTLRDLGLTTPQWAALGCLGKTEWLCGADMARMHHVTPQTMTTILQNLSQTGFIVREPHPTHGKVVRILLTDEGRQRLEEATRRVEAVQAQMLGDLDEQEREMLVELLGRCAQNLRAAGVPDGAGCPD